MIKQTVDPRFRNVLNPYQTFREVRSQSKTLEKIWRELEDAERRRVFRLDEERDWSAEYGLGGE